MRTIAEEEMDKSKIWAKCLTTTHNGEACSEDCLIQEYIERQLNLDSEF